MSMSTAAVFTPAFNMCFMSILYFVLYPNLSVSIVVTNYLILGSYKHSPRA